MPGFESKSSQQLIGQLKSDKKKMIKSQFEYDLDRILAGGWSNRISLEISAHWNSKQTELEMSFS